MIATLVFLAVFLVLVWTSAWLKGLGWFVATLGALAAAIVSLELTSHATESALDLWIRLGALTLLFGFFFYFLGARYITGTSVRDMTYQSHGALTRFIDENRLSSPLATVLRVLGPLLLGVATIYAGFLAWAKFSGVIQ